MRLDLVGTCKMSGKFSNFFLCPNRLRKVSRNRFIAFLDNSKHSVYVHKNFLKKVQKRTLELKFEFPLSIRGLDVERGKI